VEGFDQLSKPRILVYDGPWWYPGRFIGWCGQSVQPLQSVIYSNSRVLGHGRLEWPYLTCVEFWFYKNVFRKVEFVLDGVLGGYCCGMGMVRSTCRVLPKEWRGSCVIDPVL
jgi:hypothetical protein